jgi:predicted ATP-dependent endonuclease of OLD family
MPDNDEAAAKFLKQAVRAYPDLYFARFVVLGEGASEEIIFPRLAAALGFHIDPSFVAIVPLGGRHVNHLWRLLTDLAIPYATLLDLDWGRHGGGWGRIKTVCQQLLENGVSLYLRR